MSAMATRDLVEIDERRLLRRLDDLAQRGALAQGGIYRPLYSSAWSSAMELVASWMKGAGLLVKRDAVGNVWGRIEGSRGGRVIATGSHIDTVRGGGALDGARGVVAGIEEVSRLWQRCGRSTRILERFATVGTIGVEPSQVNVVPGLARFTVDTRHPDPGRRSELITQIGDACKKIATERGLGLEIKTLRDRAPVTLSPRLVDVLRRASVT